MSEQLYTPADEKHFAHGKPFRITETLDFDFVGRGKKVPAVRILRLPDNGVTIVRREEFEKNFVPLAGQDSVGRDSVESKQTSTAPRSVAPPVAAPKPQ